MADNVTTQSALLATPPTATVIGTDEVAGVHYQRMKLVDGTDGSSTGIPGNAGGLHVQGGKGALTDGSANITAASVSEEIFAANATRRYLIVQNVSDTRMWVNFGVAANAGQPSFLLPPNGGGIVFEGTFVPTDSVNILCETISKPFTAKEA